MPALAELLARRAELPFEAIEDVAELVEREATDSNSILEKRILIPCCNTTSPPGLVEAETVDPWQKSGKYALGWVYFCVILLVIVAGLRWYHFWHDKIRTAVKKERHEYDSKSTSPDTNYELSELTGRSTQKFFPREGPLPEPPKEVTPSWSGWPFRITLALCRSVFYRPIPNLYWRKRHRPVVFPGPGTVVVVVAAAAFTLCYTFVPQPLYWQSIRFGSPPVAIRSGMIAVAMMPWIIALSMKANIISIITGIGHERLNVLHRLAAYICLLLSLIHTVPFYIHPIWDRAGYHVFRNFFMSQHYYVYGSGLAALVPLIFLCVHSLPPLRRHFYELFVMIHVPVSILLLGMLFWHCHNYLTSWNYLYATVAIWASSYLMRLLYLNWTHPGRISWLIGEEAAVTLLPESAVKITIPTQVKWRPGQYVYLRMPGVAVFDNHPFTIASLCSDDFPSEYGEEYRDMVLVFRPFAGFTKKVVESALEHGPWHTYRAFLDGPYGGMRRTIQSFDNVVVIAGGSGITAVISHLLDLIKRMRDGKAVTTRVQVLWAMKRPETMEWFKEELRICREFAPANSVRCQFYITAAKRQTAGGTLVSAQTPTRPVSTSFHDKVNDVFQHIAENRFSTNSGLRNSQIVEQAQGDSNREKELRIENDDRLRPLPQAHMKQTRIPSPAPASEPGLGITTPSDVLAKWAEDAPSKETPHMPPHPTMHEKRQSKHLALDISEAQQVQAEQIQQASTLSHPQQFDFGFPQTPTEFQKNLMRFAFMPAAVKSRKSGWSTEWGRPAIPHMLREMSEEWTGRRTCVFVCGPPSMRVDVCNTVAELQKMVLRGEKDEIYLHTENYAL